MVTDQARAGGGLQSPASFCTPSISHHLSFYHLGINHNYSFALEHSPSTKDANTGDSEGKIKYRKETELWQQTASLVFTAISWDLWQRVVQ